jgi:hypothetical protein
MTTATTPRTSPDPTVLAIIPAGTPVEVQNRFTASWSRGFEVAEVVRDAVHPLYRLRRVSDRFILPDLFDQEAVRLRS